MSSERIAAANGVYSIEYPPPLGFTFMCAYTQRTMPFAFHLVISTEPLDVRGGYESVAAAFAWLRDCEPNLDEATKQRIRRTTIEYYYGEDMGEGPTPLAPREQWRRWAGNLLGTTLDEQMRLLSDAQYFGKKRAVAPRYKPSVLKHQPFKISDHCRETPVAPDKLPRAPFTLHCLPPGADAYVANATMQPSNHEELAKYLRTAADDDGAGRYYVTPENKVLVKVHEPKSHDGNRLAWLYAYNKETPPRKKQGMHRFTGPMMTLAWGEEAPPVRTAPVELTRPKDVIKRPPPIPKDPEELTAPPIEVPEVSDDEMITSEAEFGELCKEMGVKRRDIAALFALVMGPQADAATCPKPAKRARTK